MPTSSVVLTEQQREESQTAKLEALRKAAQVGWDDIAAGRYTDFDETGLREYILGMGRPASRAVCG